ncbi:MAG: hypothetical protein HDR75_05595 [Bacteroides sp.]|nr:hypothetical protein [Bacteroides sp.]
MAKKTADYIRTIVKALKDSSRYSEGLDIQILSLAGAIRTLELANDDIDGLDSVTMQIVSRYGNDTLAPHPAFKIQKDAQESVTKQMKALGLTAEQLMGADENDPLIELGTKILDATKKTSKTIKPAKKK